MRVQIKRPENPIPKEFFPQNREHQTRNGVWVKCGTVIKVDTGDSWETIGKLCDGIPAEEVAYANFETYDPAEINWYLKEYVGCHKPGPHGFNFMFDGATPGLILAPFRDALINHVVERAHKNEERRRRRTILDKRWDKRNIDIPEGEKLVVETRESIYRRVQDHVPNSQDFNFQKELTDFLVGEAFSGGKDLLSPHQALAKGLLKPLKELHPENDRVRQLRMKYYEAFANGVATELFNGHNYPLHDKLPGEKEFFDAGVVHARQMSGLQRYQFVMGLMERARRYGLQGVNPIYQQKANFSKGFGGQAVAYYLSRELSSSRLLERNIHDTPLKDDLKDAIMDNLEEKAKEVIGF
ncbi:hypothetical protein [uncultured Roseibium sp.]|uniref:hypothetical protein n=1 Tax=uncultured Roseibium sp. TaxID=1936171 RepID=UPI00262ADB79|nr:hypothetical protein [uncultured Roseibium sp.]